MAITARRKGILVFAKVFELGSAIPICSSQRAQLIWEKNVYD